MEELVVEEFVMLFGLCVVVYVIDSMVDFDVGEQLVFFEECYDEESDEEYEVSNEDDFKKYEENNGGICEEVYCVINVEIYEDLDDD